MRRKYVKMKIKIPKDGDVEITMKVPIAALRALFVSTVSAGVSEDASYRQFIHRIIARTRDSLAASSRAVLRGNDLTEEDRAALPEIVYDQILDGRIIKTEI